MYSQTHFLFSYLVGLIFVKFGVFDLKTALFIGFVAVLVDLDHYITFLFKYRKMNLREAWNKHVKGMYGGRSFIHHWIGFVLMIVVIFVLFYYNMTWFWIIGLGYFTHILMDYGHFNFLKIRGRVTINEAGFVEKISKFELLLDGGLLIGVILLLV